MILQLIRVSPSEYQARYSPLMVLFLTVTKAAEQFIKNIEEMQAASPTDRGSAAL